MTEPLGVMFDQLYRRAMMARAMGCKPETIAVLEAALCPVTELMTRVLASQRARLRKRAEDLGWAPCEIHGRHSGRPMIDCGFCQRANVVTNSDGDALTDAQAARLIAFEREQGI